MIGISLFGHLSSAEGQSAANSSLKSDSLVTGKNTGNFTGTTIRGLLIRGKIRELRRKFPSGETGKLSKAQQPIDVHHQGIFYLDQGRRAEDGAR
jgi:hypothetical protein